MARSKKQKMMKAAGKAPTWVRDIASSKGTNPHGLRRFQEQKLGKFGPASEVRHIDPKDWQPQKKL